MLGSLAAQRVKNLPAMQEPGVQPRGQEDRGRQRKRWLDGIADSTDMRASTLWETEDRAGWRAVVHGAAESDTTE